jgi:hypothetical protein
MKAYTMTQLLIHHQNSPEKYVEIGAWKGKSVCYAAVAIINSEKNITIDSVDTWEGSPGEPLLWMMNLSETIHYMMSL